MDAQNVLGMMINGTAHAASPFLRRHDSTDRVILALICHTRHFSIITNMLS